MITTILSLYLALVPQFQTTLYSIDNLLFIVAEVNGKPATFLIDSGSPATILDSRQAKRFGFKATGPERSVSGLCKSHTWQAATHAEVRIEGNAIYPLLATADLICMQQKFSRSLPAPLIGIMGNDVLATYGADVDIQASTLTLQPSSTPASLEPVFAEKKP